MSLESIIEEGNKQIDLAIERVIFKHTYQIEIINMTRKLCLKCSSRNSIPVGRINLSPEESGKVIELLSITVGYFYAT